jgi:DNA replication protein DnaC
MTEAEKPEAVQKIESIIARRQQGTETLRKSWNSGDLTQQQLPCHDACNGQITIGDVHGKCPVYMKPGTCPLVEEKEKELQVSMSEAGFGPRYHYPDTSRLKALTPVDEFLSALPGCINRGRGIIITGDVGVGKTTTLAYLARKILEHGYTVWCVHVPQLIELLKTDARRDVIRRAMLVDVLMFDDLGSGEMDGDILGAMEGIVEYRYANHRMTMATTNMTHEQLVANVPLRRIVDRWRQTNMMLKIGGTNERRRPEAVRRVR